MIIVYGGAFNPPTKAHMEVYHFLKKNLSFEKFIYLPVSKAYQKNNLEENAHRFKMLTLMTDRYSDIIVSPLELEDTTYRGTYASLKRIKALYQKDVAFVMGADHIANLSNWIKVDALLKEFKIIILNRDSENLNSIFERHPWFRPYQSSIIMFNQFHREESSSKFRETQEANLLDETVYQYILQHHLYKR